MKKATPEQQKAGMDAWMAWAKRAGAALVDLGSPLGEVRIVGDGAAGTAHLGGFSILQAESIDAVTTILEGHPHLTMPGAAIEIREFMPIPGM